MKSLLSAALILIVSQLFSQNSIWIRINTTPELKNGVWTLNDDNLDQKISNYQILDIKQAVPVARTKKLSTIWEISCQCDVNDLIRDLNRNRLEDLAVPAPNYTPLYTPNDYNLISGGNWPLELIGAESAWDISQSSPNFKIGISDQNIDPNHEELIGKVNNFDPTNLATTTHGTAVAIVAAGSTNNEIGLSSIGFRSSINFYQMNFNGILQAAYDGIDVINISWSSGCFYNQYERDIVDEAWNLGTFLVAAAGNGNTCGSPQNLVYPAAYTHVFSVSSIGESDNHEQWPGDTLSTHQHNDMVDLVAPGYDVPISPAQGWYIQSSGTSFAAPFVTGTIALMLSKNPCLTNQQIEQILKSTAKDIYPQNPLYLGLLGSGRLDSKLAVLAAANYQTPEIDITQSWSGQSGQISVDVSNLQQPVEVVWSGGLIGTQNSQLTSGNYDIMIVDAHGCQIDTTIQLLEVSNPVVDSSYEVVDLPATDLANGQNTAEIYETHSTDFTVYPNPSNGQVFISSQSLDLISIISSNGSKVFENQFFGQIQLRLESGVYFIHSKRGIKKLIVV